MYILANVTEKHDTHSQICVCGAMRNSKRRFYVGCFELPSRMANTNNNNTETARDINDNNMFMEEMRLVAPWTFVAMMFTIGEKLEGDNLRSNKI